MATLSVISGRDFTADNNAILNVLKTGRDYTANQLRTRLNIQNISARINDLRNAGYPVYLNRKTTANRAIFVYRLGTPSRRDIAIARAIRRQPALLAQIENDVQRALRLV